MVRRTIRSSEQGFTSAELMIILAVGVIIAAAGIPAVSTTLNDFNLVLSGQQLANQLQFARMRAVSSNEMLRVRFDVATGTYQIELEDGTVHTGPFTLPRGVDLNAADGDPVSFPGDELLFLPNGALPINGTGSAGRVKLVGRTGLKIDIVVDSGGMVRTTPSYKSASPAF